jgi:1,4-dihydroxy-2-naphthoate polyprenyltransferase
MARPDPTQPTQPTLPPPIRPGSLQAWQVALRPRSLGVAMAPVLVGTALAGARTGSVDGLAAAGVLAAALLMQLITNLQNDVGYTLRGAEASGTRRGWPRATAQGWLGTRQVQMAIVALSIAATIVGLLLVLHRGWPVLAIGIASLAAALAYMGGPRPIAYTPFGELTVAVFFGGVAVAGTEWVLAGHNGVLTPPAALGVGSIAAAALAVNNLRDVAHDREVGRRTLAVCLGPRHGNWLYTGLLALPFAAAAAMALLAHQPGLLLPLLLARRAARLPAQLRQAAAADDPAAFNAVLARTFGMGLAYAVLLAAGLLVGRLPGLAG